MLIKIKIKVPHTYFSKCNYYYIRSLISHSVQIVHCCTYVQLLRFRIHIQKFTFMGKILIYKAMVTASFTS